MSLSTCLGTAWEAQPLARGEASPRPGDCAAQRSGSISGWWKAVLHRPRHGLGSMADADLAIRTPDVGLDRVDAEEAVTGDLLVGPTLDDQGQARPTRGGRGRLPCLGRSSHRGCARSGCRRASPRWPQQPRPRRPARRKREAAPPRHAPRSQGQRFEVPSKAVVADCDDHRAGRPFEAFELGAVPVFQADDVVEDDVGFAVRRVRRSRRAEAPNSVSRMVRSPVATIS